jgi:hypothetical protein
VIGDDRREQEKEGDMGATVEQPTSYRYRFYCPACEVRGSDHDSEDGAQREGLEHEMQWHPRVYTVEQVGSYD